LATSGDIDAELITRFCGALNVGDRADFRRAAEAALAQLPCSGPGIAYRTLWDVFRQYFHPPDDHVAGATPRHRGGKLVAGPPIGAEDPRTGGRDRHRLKG